MAIKSSSQVTITDLTDAPQLSCYITSNLPKAQIYDSNTGGYSPSWTAAALILTPVVMVGQTNLALGSPGLTVAWKRKDGSGAETALTAGETAGSTGILTVNQNKLSASGSGMVTYVMTVSYTDPVTKVVQVLNNDITFSLTKTGINAKMAWIAGDQVFKYTAAGAVSPATITLTASTQQVTVSKWQYKKSDGTWADYPTGTITGSTLTVAPAHTVFVGDMAQIRVVTSDANVTDTITIVKVRDGATGSAGTAGAAAKICYLSNEAVLFAAAKDGSVSAQTFTCDVFGFVGATAANPTVTVSGLPTGITSSVGTAASGKATVTFTVAAGTLGGADSGKITLTAAVSGTSFTKYISWAKSKTGATGATGAAGVSAVTFTVYAPQGTAFLNSAGTLQLATQAYIGATQITSGASYQWQQMKSGTWTNLSGATSATYTVAATLVQGSSSFKCIMTYSGKTYQDVITLIDKTDICTCTCSSVIGFGLSREKRYTVIQCNYFENGIEQDGIGSATISTTAPASPAANALWWKIDTTAKAVTLMKYSGSAWAAAAAADKPKMTYNWYTESGKGTAFATGKMIYVDADMVDGTLDIYVDVLDA